MDIHGHQEASETTTTTTTEDVPTRAVLRATHLAEQLVEVPTIISFPVIALLRALLAQRTVEHNVDIPAVGGSGTGGGLSGSPRTELFYDCRADR